MKTVIFQNDIIWHDPAANRERMRAEVSAAPRADLYVFPEMCSTGFTMDSSAAEQDPSETLALMRELAAEKDAAVAGSIALKEGEKLRNRFYFVFPDGSCEFYDKHHLFTYSSEDRTYEAGNEKLTVEWRGLRIRLIVCYDLRFPSWCRCNDDYDVLLCVASWPSPRRFAWDTLLAARAIENQCYVCAANRVGTDPKCIYNGGSAVYGPFGELLAKADDGKECYIEAELEPRTINEARRNFPALKDRDIL